MEKDKVYLKHILDAIFNIEKFIKNITKEEFLKIQKKQYAVLRGLEIIGEVTKNLSRGVRRKYEVYSIKI